MSAHSYLEAAARFGLLQIESAFAVFLETIGALYFLPVTLTGWRGDLRQLQEIWLIEEDGDGPRHQIVSELAHRILANTPGACWRTCARS